MGKDLLSNFAIFNDRLAVDFIGKNSCVYS